MQRRLFLALCAALATSAPAAASDVGHVDYSRAAFDEAIASGQPVMLDFYAPW